MNRRLPIAASVTLLAILACAGTPARAATGLPSAHGFAPHQVLVKFAGSGAGTFDLRPSADVVAVVAALRDNPQVEYAAPNYIATASITTPVEPAIPNDPGPIAGLPGPTGGWVTKQWNFLPWQGEPAPLLPISPGGIDAIGAWENLVAAGRPGAQGVTVAVLDTGIAYRTLSPRFLRSPDFTSGQFVKGYDFVDGDSLPLDENGHGTQVAGTTAEKTNNGIGLAGLAYRAKLMPVRVLDEFGRDNLRRLADRDDRPGPHRDQVRRVPAGMVEVVQHGDQGPALLRVQIGTKIEHLDLMGDVQERGRLVEQQDRRLLRQRHRKPDPLPLPA